MVKKKELSRYEIRKMKEAIPRWECKVLCLNCGAISWAIGKAKQLMIEIKCPICETKKLAPYTIGNAKKVVPLRRRKNSEESSWFPQDQ